MDAEPADHRHQPLKESIAAGDTIHFAVGHVRFGKTVCNGNGEGIHRKADAEQKTIENE